MALASQHPAEHLPRPRVRWTALRRAIDYVESQARHAPVTVGELAKASGVCERTLERSFQEHFGVAPKFYLLTLRLNGVRRDLLAVDAGQSTVKAAANRWGFWHLGQFAGDYRKLFDEAPSATLNRWPDSRRRK